MPASFKLANISDITTKPSDVTTCVVHT